MQYKKSPNLPIQGFNNYISNWSKLSPDIGEIISFILSSDGYSTKLFSNATKFLKNILKIEADIVIFDIALSDGNGLELEGREIVGQI